MPEPPGLAPVLLFRALAKFWQDLARPADYPLSQRDWLELVGQPVAIDAALDWGLALGSTDVAARLGRPRLTRLGRLIRAYETTGDARSAEVLAAMLDRGIRHAGGGRRWDALIVPPPSFASGPPYGVSRLLPVADEQLPPPLPVDTWKRRSARERPTREDTDALAADAVSGLRILLVALQLRGAGQAEPWTLALYRGGAARVGLLAIGLAAGSQADRPSAFV